MTTDTPTRYSREEIEDIIGCLWQGARMPHAARRAIEQLLSDLDKAHEVIEDAVRIYGKYGALINEPGKAGEWIEKAHKTLEEIA